MINVVFVSAVQARDGGLGVPPSVTDIVSNTESAMLLLTMRCQT